VKADYNDVKKIVWSWAFPKKHFKAVFGAFLAQSACHWDLFILRDSWNCDRIR